MTLQSRCTCSRPTRPSVGDVTRVDEYRARLRTLETAQWQEFLTAHSGLPGPRGNIELGKAVAEEADARTVDALLATDDEYLVFCGVVGLGRLLADSGAGADGDRLGARLREHAADTRWRVCEAVAMALQRPATPTHRGWWRSSPTGRRRPRASCSGPGSPASASLGCCGLPRWRGPPSTPASASRHPWPRGRPTSAGCRRCAPCGRRSATAGAWRWPQTRRRGCRASWPVDLPRPGRRLGHVRQPGRGAARPLL